MQFTPLVLTSVFLSISICTSSVCAQQFFDEPIGHGQLLSDLALERLYDDPPIEIDFDSLEGSTSSSLFESIFGPVLEVGELICQPVITFGKGAINYTVVTVCTLPPVGPVLLLTGTARPTDIFGENP